MSSKPENLFKRAFVFLLLLLLGLTTSKYLLLAHTPLPQDGIVYFFIDVFVEGIMVMIVLDVFLRKEEQSILRSAISTSIGEVLTGKLNSLDPRVQDNIVKESIHSRLVDPYGPVLYNDFIAPYIKNYKYYRSGFYYDVKFSELNPAEDFLLTTEGGAAFGKVFKEHADRYNWCRQVLRYRRKGFKDPDAPMEFLPIHFFFTEEDLVKSFEFDIEANDNVFMREILSIGRLEKEALLSTLDDNEALSDILDKVFQLKAWTATDEVQLKSNFRWRKCLRSGVDFIEVDIENQNGKLENSGCELEFRMPWLKESTKFVMVLPVPVEAGAQLSFEKAPNQRSLSLTSFLSRSYTDKTEIRKFPRNSDEPEKISVAVKGWAFPTSGVVFHWMQQKP